MNIVSQDFQVFIPHLSIPLFILKSHPKEKYLLAPSAISLKQIQRALLRVS